jgi:hypothetical protein
MRKLYISAIAMIIFSTSCLIAQDGRINTQSGRIYAALFSEDNSGMYHLFLL